VGVPNEDVKKECVEYGKMIGRLVLSGDKHGETFEKHPLSNSGVRLKIENFSKVSWYRGNWRQDVLNCIQP